MFAGRGYVRGKKVLKYKKAKYNSFPADSGGMQGTLVNPIIAQHRCKTEA